MKEEFEMSMMGDLKFFIGLQIIQKYHDIFIHQEKFTKDHSKRFRMDEAKPIATPMHPSTVIYKDEKGNDASEKDYRCMIGSLLYLTTSRPYILFVVCLCARFQSCPKVSHVTVVKIILRYLVGTTNRCPWFEKGPKFDLVSYYDVDFVGDKVERNSISGAIPFL